MTSRSPKGKVESYVKEFARLGVPLTAARGGFYESLEIRDLISLFQVLDNPLQDYPLLAVLRSPMGGFSADDLAFVRAENPRGRFWTALVRWRESRGAGGARPELTQRAGRFLDRFHAWRRLTREQPLSRVLERVLDETSYAEWLLTQDRGSQRRANVDRLLQLTRQFDSFQREGLFRFLKFVEGQQDMDVVVAFGRDANIVGAGEMQGLDVLAPAERGPQVEPEPRVACRKINSTQHFSITQSNRRWNSRGRAWRPIWRRGARMWRAWKRGWRS